MCVCVYVCVRAREHAYVCDSVSERERERERETVCACTHSMHAGLFAVCASVCAVCLFVLACLRGNVQC